MKKILIASAAALLLLAPLAAQTITVKSPQVSPGSPTVYWCVGEAHTISWQCSSVPGTATMTIALRFAGSAPDAAPALVIASGTANDWEYGPWTIPNTVAPGDYFLRVRTDDATVVGDGPVFKIASGPAIIITSPHANDTVCVGGQFIVRWDKACAMQNKVTIALRYEGSAPDAAPARVLLTGEPNDGGSGCRLHETIVPGRYFVRVRTDDATVIGDSPVFNIRECKEIVSLTLLEPNGNETWEIPKTGYGSYVYEHLIRWKLFGWNGKVNLILMQNGKYKGLIAQHVPALTQSYEWLPGMLSNGKKVDYGIGFRVRVVREYPGLEVPLQALMDDSDGDFTLINMR
jgi:hypothetical protein